LASRLSIHNSHTQPVLHGTHTTAEGLSKAGRRITLNHYMGILHLESEEQNGCLQAHETQLKVQMIIK
jgi:hypothetical protein